MYWTLDLIELNKANRNWSAQHGEWMKNSTFKDGMSWLPNDSGCSTESKKGLMLGHGWEYRIEGNRGTLGTLAKESGSLL